MSSNALELHVRRVARELHAAQIARLYKIPNDMKIANGYLLHAEQTPADFMGFTITGRVIILECKMTTRPLLPMGPKGLKPHQVIAINEVHRAGGLGLVAWMHAKKIAVIDAGQVTAYRGAKRSIAWRDIPDDFKHCVSEAPLRLFWPFLS